MTKIAKLLQSTKAATAVEYGLILALIFLVASVAVAGVGTKTNQMWNNVSSTTAAVL